MAGGFDSTVDMLFKIGGETSGFDTAMAKVMAGAKGALIAGIGFGSIGGALVYMAKTAMDAEKATTLLKLSLENAKGGSQGMLDNMDGLSKKMASLSGFTNTELKGALTQLTNSTGDANVAFKALQPTINFAIAEHMNLESASRLVARAYERGGVVLSRYIPSLRGVGAGMQAVDAIGKKFNGTMEAFGNTAEGSLARAKADVDLLAESFGKVLLKPVADVADAIAGAAQWAEHLYEQFNAQHIDDALKNLESLKDKIDEVQAALNNPGEPFWQRGTDQKALQNLTAAADMQQKQLLALLPTPDIFKPAGAGIGETEPGQATEKDMLKKYLEEMGKEAKKSEEALKHLAETAGAAFEKLGEDIVKDGVGGLKTFAKTGVETFIDAIATMIKAQMGFDAVIGNWGGVALGAAELTGLGVAKGVVGNVMSAPSASRVSAPSAGGQGGGNAYHVHVHVDNLQNPDRIMQETLAPAFARYVRNNHGGNISKSNGSLVWGG